MYSTAGFISFILKKTNPKNKKLNKMLDCLMKAYLKVSDCVSWICQEALAYSNVNSCLFNTLFQIFNCLKNKNVPDLHQ